MRALLSILLSVAACHSAPMGFWKPFGRAEVRPMIVDNFDRATVGADWLIESSANYSMYNSNLLAVGAGDRADYLSFTNWYSTAENIMVEWDQYFITTNATTSGVFFAWRSASVSTTRNLWAGIYGATGSQFGKAMLGRNDAGSFEILVEAPAGRVVTGFGQTWIKCKATVTQNSYHFFATNEANGSFTHTNFTWNYQESGNITPTARYYGFQVMGGSNLVDNFRVTLMEPQSPSRHMDPIPLRIPTYLLLVGKSIDDGSSATNADIRYFNQLVATANYPSYNSSGGFNGLTNYLRIANHGEYGLYRPMYTWIGYGTDIIWSRSSNDWTADMALLVGTLRTNGHDVNVMAAQPNNTADQRPHNLVVSNSVAAAGFVNNPVYAAWTEMRTNDFSGHPPFYVADVVHPNHIGHTNIFNALSTRYLRP